MLTDEQIAEIEERLSTCHDVVGCYWLLGQIPSLVAALREERKYEGELREQLRHVQDSYQEMRRYLIEAQQKYTTLATAMGENDAKCPEGCNSYGHVEDCLTYSSAHAMERMKQKLDEERERAERAEEERDALAAAMPSEGADAAKWAAIYKARAERAEAEVASLREHRCVTRDEHIDALQRAAMEALDEKIKAQEEVASLREYIRGKNAEVTIHESFARKLREEVASLKAEHDAALEDATRKVAALVGEIASLKAELGRLSLGLHSRSEDGNPAMQQSAVASALAWIDRLKAEVERLQLYVKLDGGSAERLERDLREALDALERLRTEADSIAARHDDTVLRLRAMEADLREAVDALDLAEVWMAVEGCNCGTDEPGTCGLCIVYAVLRKHGRLG